MFSFQAACLRSQIHDRDTGRIIDKNRRTAEPVRRLNQFVPFALIQLARSQTRGINATFRAHHALHELLFTHLEGKECDFAVMKTTVCGNIKGKCRFTHRRTRSH